MIIDLEDLAREVLNEFHGMTAGRVCGHLVLIFYAVKARNISYT